MVLQKRFWQAPMLLLAATACLCLILAGSAASATDNGNVTTAVAAPADQATGSTDGPRAAIPTGDIWKILQDGGLPMYAIVACSFVLVAVLLERCVSLRRSRVIPKPFVTRFLHQLREGEIDRQQALELCDGNASPVAKVFAGALRKWGRPSVEVEQGVIDAGERVTNGLRRYLRVFYAIATVGPLLGLMGTVLGMIQTFNVIADPSADAIGRAAPLAGGIAKALLNTAGGLSVAIPASLLYVFFVSWVDRLVVEIDRLGQEVVNLISAEELREKKSPPQKTHRLAS